MMNNQPFQSLALQTFAPINLALCLARMRVGVPDDLNDEPGLDLINEDEVLAVLSNLPDEVVCDDALKINFHPDSAVVLKAMEDCDFCPDNTRHFALGLCLFAAIHIRGSFSGLGEGDM